MNACVPAGAASPPAYGHCRAATTTSSRRLDNPFSGNARVLQAAPLGNESFIVGMAVQQGATAPNNRIFWRLEVACEQHDASRNGVLMASRSFDAGLTQRNFRTIHSDGNGQVTEGTRIGNMDGDRIGGMLVKTISGARVAHFLKTDDYFETLPTVTSLAGTIVGPDPFFYYKAVRYPAADGGHDSQGWLWPYYTSTQTEARAIVTANNGASFSDVLLHTVGSLGAVNETIPIRLPDGRWMLFARSANLLGTRLYVALAQNLVSLPAAPWRDTGVEISNNPFCVVLDQGNIALSVIDRGNATSTMTRRNIQRIYVVPATELFDANGVFPSDFQYGHQFTDKATGQFTPYELMPAIS